MDFKKLDNLNGHYLRESSDEVLTAEVVTFLTRETPPKVLNIQARKRLSLAMPGLKERAKTLVELVQAAEFLFADGPRVLDPASEKLLSAEARAILAKVIPALNATDWSVAALEAATRDFAVAEGLKLGQVAQPLRAALTGKSASPPVFEIMSVLGREESLSRLGAYAALRD
jgi:glutamyl-tRNA synthetase